MLVHTILPVCKDVKINEIKQACNRKQQLRPPVPPPSKLDETRVAFDSGPLAPLCDNMTSYIKPEVHNILHCRHNEIKPRPQVTCVENFVKFGTCGVWDTRANRHTNIQTYTYAESRNTSHHYREQSNTTQKNFIAQLQYIGAAASCGANVARKPGDDGWHGGALGDFTRSANETY